MELFLKIEKAIKAINPNAHYIIRENNLDMIEWDDDTTPISKADIEAKMAELTTEEEEEAAARENLKASAKAKLIAGEPLTAEEADTIVL